MNRLERRVFLLIPLLSSTTVHCKGTNRRSVEGRFEVWSTGALRKKVKNLSLYISDFSRSKLKVGTEIVADTVELVSRIEETQRILIILRTSSMYTQFTHIMVSSLYEWKGTLI